MSIDIFNEKLNDMLIYIKNNQYIFEITKCCNYSVFIHIYKDATLTELYNWISYHFQNKNFKLYVVSYDSIKKRMEIPNVNNITTRDFVNNNKSFFIPIYPLPANVVYKIFIDDGYCHDKIDTSNNVCIIHS